MASLLLSTAFLALLSGSALAMPQPGRRPPMGHKVIRADGSTAATTTGNITLAPINQTTTLDAFTPTPNITLSYGQDSTASENAAVVNITLTTAYDGVLLEAIEGLASVDCASDSVSLTFNDAATLDSAYKLWSGYKQLLLVTNNVGDCDSEFERGFFVSSSFESFANNLTLKAGTVKKELTDVASFIRAHFSGLPTGSSTTPSRRDIVVDPDDVTVSADFAFGPITLYEYQDSITVTAEKAAVDVSVTVGGYLDYDVLKSKVEALYIDVETTASADLVLGLGVHAPYTKTFSYDAGLEYYLIGVAGILTFGPAISLSVGADLSFDAGIDVTLALGAAVDKGTLHMDLVGDSKQAGGGWETPTHYANLTLAESMSVGVSPFVALTVELDFELLGGALDLSSGLTPKLEFPTTAKLGSEQGASAGSGGNQALTITDTGSDGCSNGLQVESAFELSLNAFVTEYWSDVLYNYTVPIADKCYVWA